MNYAAADAIVALHIIQSLVELKLARQDKRESLAGLSEEADVSTKISLRPIATPSARLQPLEEWLSEEENASCLLSMCQGIVEMPYKQRRRSSQVYIIHTNVLENCTVEPAYIITVTDGPKIRGCSNREVAALRGL